jgi:predicted nucleotidyltransferase
MVDNDSKLIEKAKADESVLAVILYGSRVRGEETPISDRDICLVLRPGDYNDLRLSEKKLEYLKSFDMDIQVYQQLPVYMKTRVLKEGSVLFCRDEDMLYEVAYLIRSGLPYCTGLRGLQTHLLFLFKGGCRWPSWIESESWLS